MAAVGQQNPCCDDLSNPPIVQSHLGRDRCTVLGTLLGPKFQPEKQLQPCSGLHGAAGRERLPSSERASVWGQIPKSTIYALRNCARKALGICEMTGALQEFVGVNNTPGWLPALVQQTSTDGAFNGADLIENSPALLEAPLGFDHDIADLAVCLQELRHEEHGAEQRRREEEDGCVAR